MSPHDNTTTDSKVDALDRLDAMLEREESAIQCYNYLGRSSCLESGIDEECRASMIQWCQQVRKALKLSSETVWIGANFLDRYLSSGHQGKSNDALSDKYEFQLAAIASFYLAVELYERIDLNAKMLAEMCRGYYPEEDIVSMREGILFALDWTMTTPTPMDFVREFVQLLPKQVEEKTRKLILKTTRKHLEYATNDFCLSFYAPSAVGAACLSSALLNIDFLNANERKAFWKQLTRTANLIDVMEVENKLLEGRSLYKPIAEADTKKKSIISRVPTAGGNSSPVCISHTARAA